MFKISVEGETLEELASNLLDMGKQFQTTVPQAKTTRRKTAQDLEPARPKPEPEAADDEEDAELQRELNEPVAPMPETAKQVVDAGTGKPAPAADASVQKMTPEDVKVAAAKLAAKDAPKLGEILKSYGAAKLSEVPKEKLGEFASDVLEALEA